LRTDLTANFIAGASGSLSFGYALNSFVSNSAYAAAISVYDAKGALLASARDIGQYTSTPSGVSSFPEGRIEIAFDGIASRADFAFTSQFGRYIIDNLEGTFSAPKDPVREITVFDQSPYDGVISGRRFSGIESTFGYSFSGTEISAEFIVRGNHTLQDLADAKGFEYFNWVQIATEYPDPLGILSGCLGNTPFYDPPQGGCLLPRIVADELPFYYDVGPAWSGTEFYIGDRMLQGIDRSVNQLVDVGIRFDDQPFSPYATADSPMSFILFPVGVYADGTWETLVTENLQWFSTNNFFGGSAGPLMVGRSNPIDDGLEGTVLSGSFVPFTALSPQERELLTSRGMVGISAVPEPGSLLLLALGLALLRLFARGLIAESRGPRTWQVA
jgi:hypothetical protein